MRLAFLCTSGIDNASPRGRWLPITRELARLGHTPHLVLLHPMFNQLPPAQRACLLDGVHIDHVEQMHVYGPPGQRRYYPPAQLAWVTLRGAIALATHTIRLRPEAIHICKPQPANGLAGLLAAAWLRVPLFVHCDDYEAEANRFGPGLAGRLQKSVVRWFEDMLPHRARAITVNTRFLQTHFIQVSVSAQNITLIPNGFSEDFHPLPRQHDGRTVLYLGTLSEISHGVGLLLQAFAQVLQQVPNAHLLMVGDGDDRPALQHQAAQLSIAHAIQWVGHVPATETPRYYARATCSVDPVYDLPVMRARSPLKIAESMAAGVPIVTGDVGDRREMIGAAGVIVQPGDAAALANGLLHVLRHAELQDQMATQAHVQSQTLTWRHLVQTAAHLYTHAP